MKSFETGLRDDILASNLRATLCTPGLTDEELMKQVNELASQKAERNTKLATKRQKTTKVNACVVSKEGGEQKTRSPSVDRSQQILSEIRRMKSEINDLKGRVNAQGGRAAKPDVVDPPTEAREVVTSQGTEVGVVRVVKSVEEVRNVTIVLLVVALDT